MGGANIKLADVVVAVSGFVVREHCVLSPAWPACYRTWWGGNCLPWKVQFSVAVAERPSHHRHGAYVAWTHPESVLQVALINRADIALTLFYLSWQNPVLPAPQTLMWYRRDEARSWWLRGWSFHCPLLSGTVSPWLTGSVFQWPEAQFPGGLPAEISGLQVSSFYRSLATE